MSFPVRPVVAYLLCGVLLLGHAPAWLHLGTCDAHGVPAGRVAAGVTPVSHDHGCCEHAHAGSATAIRSADAPTVAGNGQHHGGSPTHPHEEDDCTLCHSLATPAGVVFTLSSVCVDIAEGDLAFTGQPAHFDDSRLSLPHPRGPPAFSV